MELNTQEELKAQLMASNDEFQNLMQRHAEMDRRVSELEGLEHLTEQEQLEEVQLKKQKLHLKDRINEMLHGKPASVA